MANRPNKQSDAEAYQSLLDLLWKERPGELGHRYRLNETAVIDFLQDLEKTGNASVGLGFMACDVLLVAGNLIAKGNTVEGWAWMDKAQAHAYWAYQVASHDTWMPSQYSSQIFSVQNFCTFFALALARGNEQQVLWYAQQLYNLRRGGVADASCGALEYLNLYWEMAIAVLNKDWPREEELSSDMGVYRDLFLSVGDPRKVQAALLVCAAYHLDLAAHTAPKNDKETNHPFRTLFVGHMAYELMGWLALHKRISGALPLTVSHPMLLPALLSAPPQKPYTDDVSEKLRANACVQFGDDWALESVPSFDKMWPGA